MGLFHAGTRWLLGSMGQQVVRLDWKSHSSFGIDRVTVVSICSQRLPLVEEISTPWLFTPAHSVKGQAERLNL